MSARAGGHPPFVPRRRASWLVFGLCALLVVDVLAWATWRVLALERAERVASAAADLAQRERLALWQMDSLVSALLARESARPYFEFRAAFASDLPYGRAWELGSASGVRTSSLSEGTGDPVVRLHFQVEPDGSVDSPQAGGASSLGAAVRAAGLRAERLVVELRRVLGDAGEPEDSMRSFAEPDAERGRLARNSDVDGDGAIAGLTMSETMADAAPKTERPGDAAADGESLAKPSGPADAELRQQLVDIARSQNRAFNFDRTGGDPGEPRVRVGLFEPRWLGGPSGDPSGNSAGEPELVFERSVMVGDMRYRQGVWIDWPALRAQLLAIAVRQMPGATLEPVLGGRGAERGPGTQTLATIPVRLRVPVEPGGVPFWSPARITLAVSWLAAIVALVAIGVVLRTAIGLADRRGRFVAAVTHELRSPLTSLRLHADLLERAPDDEKRARHVGVLRDEAARLGDVIDSVLVYAGMRSAAEAPVETSLGEALAPVLTSCRARVEGSGAAFDAAVSDEAAEAPIRIRAGSLERILGNLVDNACRYGVALDGTEGTPVVSVDASLDASRGRRVVRIRVTDDGPGVPVGERDAIFSDFYRGSSARRVHQGMGLGLALARSLARSERGDLRLVDSDGRGARFEVTLPVA